MAAHAICKINSRKWQIWSRRMLYDTGSEERELKAGDKVLVRTTSRGHKQAEIGMG